MVTRGNGKAVTAGNVQATVEIGKVGERHVAYVELTAKGRKPGTRHTNLEIDTSGSMSGVIQDVAKDTTQFVYTLGPDEHVSINVFSGHDEARCIGGPTRCDEEGKKLLARAIAREVHVRSNTVFSEALRAALDVIQRFDSEDTVHNVVLFTDGCAVPSKWNPAEEERRACALARQLREHGAVLSAIGYNVYYNPDFLRRLVAESGNLGTFQHIAEIDGFETTILDIRAVTEKTTFADLMLAFRTDKGAAKRVFRTAPEVLAIGEDGTLSVRGLYEDKLACFIELTGPATSLLLRGEIDGAPIELSPPPAQLTNEHAADYLRVLGAVAFLAGDRDTAAALLEEVGEDGLAERAATAYTDREQRETADMFRKAFRDRRFIGAGLKPKGPNRCLANALRALLEDPQAVVYLPPKAYKRGGKLTRDPRVIENPHGRTLQVTKMGSHEERRNINVLALKDVKVLPLGPDGKIDPNGRPEQKQIWRWYNIVRGGNRVIQDLCASMSPTLFEEFVAAGIIHGESDTAPGYRPGVTYDCDFRGLPDFSKSWGQATTLLQLVPLLREEQELKAEQKALNARIKDLKAEVPPEQQDPSDIYQPSEKVVEGIPVETYEERCVKYGLMKYKAKDYTDAVAKLVLGAAIMRVKEVRARLLTIRTIGRLIVMAAEATGSKLIPWGEPKVTGYGKTEQLAPYCGAQLKRTTWTETFECS